jgi:xylulokinase
MVMKYLMGIDIGTTGCKVSIYDEKLISHCSSYRQYQIISIEPTWAEEDPMIWWISVKDSIKECLQSSKLSPLDIVSAGVSCTNGLVPVNSSGDNIYNAVMQIDGRTDSQASEIEKTVGKKKIFEITGNRIAQGTFSAPIIMWLKENEPDIYNNTYKFLSPTGFIVNKLTDKFTFDHTRASTSLLYDIRNNVWSGQLCEELGIDADKLATLYQSHEVVGGITKTVALETGLCEGMPIIAGVMDSVAACIGLGTTSDKMPALIVGTVARLCLPQKELIFDDRFLNTTFTTEVPYLSMTPVNAGGLSIKWFIENFLEEETKRLTVQGKDYFDYFDEQANKIPPGSNSLIYLPYLVGERSPIWDSDARGMFFGVKLKHTKYDFYRALMEGVAFAIKDNLEIFTSVYGSKIEKITLSGGGAKSRLWTRIFVDVLGVPIIIPSETESETKGSAILAGYGVGLLKSLDGAISNIEFSILNPDISNTRMYDLLFKVYRDLYSDCRDRFKDLQKI